MLALGHVLHVHVRLDLIEAIYAAVGLTLFGGTTVYHLQDRRRRARESRESWIARGQEPLTRPHLYDGVFESLFVGAYTAIAGGMLATAVLAVIAIGVASLLGYSFD